MPADDQVTIDGVTIADTLEAAAHSSIANVVDADALEYAGSDLASVLRAY